MENENYNGQISTVLVDEFIRKLENKHNSGASYEISEENFTGMEEKISDSLIKSFFEAKMIFDAVNQSNSLDEGESDNNGTADRIRSLYCLFRDLDQDDLQILKVYFEIGKFGKIVKLREYLFNEIINELKSAVIHDKNRHSLYKLLSEMNHDYIFKYIFLHHHNMEREVFEDTYNKLKISVEGGLSFSEDEETDGTKEKEKNDDKENSGKEGGNNTGNHTAD